MLLNMLPNGVRIVLRRNLQSSAVARWNAVCYTRSFTSLPNRMEISRMSHSDHRYTASRPFSKVSDNTGTEMFFEEIFEHGLEGEDPLFDLRTYFYPDTGDPIVAELSQATSVNQVFTAFDNSQSPDYRHITQVFATLLHLQKLCNVLDGLKERYVWEIKQNFKTYNRQLLSQEPFQKMLQRLEESIDTLPYREAAFILMVLRKFGIPLSSPVMQKLYLRITNNVNDVDMEALSYLTIALRPRHIHAIDFEQSNGNTWRTGLIKIIPRLEYFAKNCESAEELKKIAICYNSMAILMSDEMMQKLESKVRQFVQEGKLSVKNESRVLNKLLSLVLSKNDWHVENGDYVRILLKQFVGSTHLLRPLTVVILSRILRNFGHPVELYEELYQTLCDHMDRGYSDYVPSIVILSSILQFNNLAMPIEEIETRLTAIIHSDHLLDTISHVYYILKCVDRVNPSVVNSFFFNCLDLLIDEPGEVRRLGAMYTALISQNHHYRNEEFEQRLSEILHEDMISTFIPKDFAESFSIYLCIRNKIPAELFTRLAQILPQLQPFSLMLISSGIESQLRNRKRSSRKFHAQRANQNEQYQCVDNMNVMVNEASLLHITNCHHLSLYQLAFLFRNFAKRRSTYDGSDFQIVTEKIVEAIITKKMSSVILHQLSMSLDAIRPVMALPNLITQLAGFVTRNPDIHLRSFLRLISFCQKTNQQPSQEFFHIVSEALVRDMYAIHGLRVLDVTIALAHFNFLTEELAKMIFSAEFMARLDKEMEIWGEDRRFVRKLREKLMLMNRLTVVKYPEYGIPWFHDRYCKEHLKEITYRPQTDQYIAFQQQVMEELATVVGGWRFIRENSHSQYYNRIDLELGLDDEGSPVDLYATPAQNISRKVALQIHDRSDFSEDTKSLLGNETLNNLELELQGWHVVSVNPFSWGSLHMTQCEARQQYLQDILPKRCSVSAT